MVSKKLSFVTAFVACALAASLPALAANGLQVSTDAKLGPLSSQYGLKVTLDDTPPRQQTFVMAGPAQGFSNETTLKGSFFINPQNLTVNNVAGVNSFQMITFLEGVSPGDPVHLIFHLNRSSANGNWFINVWHWNETLLGGSGNWQFSGGGFFALNNSPFFSNNKIDFEWTAGNPGQLTLWRTVYTNGVPDASGKIQMFSVPMPGMTNAQINYVFAGMFASHDAGTFGDLYLDEFVFTR